MNSAFFTMSTLVNKKLYAHTLHDTEWLFYEMTTSCFVKNHNLQCMKIRPHMIMRFDEPSDSSVNEVIVVQIDINRHQKSRTFFYIVSKIVFYDLILGLSWMKQNKIILNVGEVFLTIEFTETIIWNREASAKSEFNYVMMSATFFTNLIWKKEEKQKKIEVFLISMINIEKVLTSQKKTDLRTILSDHYHEFLNVFNHTMTEKLPPLREEDIDHQIELKEVNEKELKVLWGSLYNMMREKLLVLHKTLTELLNKQFIQVSNSSAAASVLFVWKSEGECYQLSLFQGKKLSFYSGDLPQLYTLLLTSITSCQMSKRKESKRKKCQKKKEHNAKKMNWKEVTNCQNNYNKLPASEKCVVSMLIISVNLFSLSYNQVSFCLNVQCFSPVLNHF